MSREVVRFQRPRLPEDAAIARYFDRSRAARWFSNDGPCLELLSERLAGRLGAGARCLPVASGTAALMVALRALMEGRRDTAREVAVPSFTYVATVSAILWSGLEPVFVDVDPESWHAAPEALSAAVEARGERLACLLPCSTFGSPPAPDVRDAWAAVGRAAGLPMLVDSAAGFGAVAADGVPLGRQGDAEAFSFHATKPFAIGEGGAVVTTDPDVYERMRQITRFGLDDDRVLRGEPGLNAKMSEIHAAIGLAVLDGFDDVLAARAHRAARLRARLEPAGFAFQAGAGRSTWQSVPVLAPDEASRAAILERASDHGVELRLYHQPLHAMAPLDRLSAVGDLGSTEDLGRRIMCLPMADDLDDDALERIVACVLGG